MRRRSGVDDQTLRVTDVGQVTEQFNRADKLDRGRVPALDAETENRSLSLRQILLGAQVVGMALQTGVQHPAHRRVRLEVPGNRQRVLAVTRHAQVQRLDTLQEQKRVEG